MIKPSFLIDKHIEIESIFSAYGSLCIRLEGQEYKSEAVPDVEILLNLAPPRDEKFIVCINTLAGFDRKPFGEGPIRAQDSFDMTMDLMMKLKSLLGCKVNVVHIKGLKNFYPVTYSAMKRS